MKYFYFFSFICLAFALDAQNFEVSPISRFGLGDINSFHSAWTRQMGGLGIGMISQGIINPINPGAQAFLRQTDVEIGVHARYKDLRNEKGQTAYDYSGNLDYIWIGIPLKNAINEILDHKSHKQSVNLFLGLTPYANSGSRYTIQDSSAQGKTTRTIEHAGPINSFTFGAAYRYKDLGFGLNMTYLFGNSRYFQQYRIINLPGSAISSRRDDINMNAWRPNLGFSYRKILNAKEIEKDKSLREELLSLGLQCYIPTNIKFDRTSLLANTWELSPGFPDTILFEKEIEEKGQMPFGIGVGVYYTHRDKYGLQWSAQSEFWKNAELHSSSFGDLQNTFSTSIGLWTRKNITGYGNFFQRTFFRYGFYYQKDYRNIQNNSPYRWGGNIGMAIPLVFLRQDAMVHLGLEAGKITTGKILNETYIQFNFGVTLNDNEWFLRRRYN